MQQHNKFKLSHISLVISGLLITAVNTHAEDVKKLETIVVTASGGSVDVRDAPASISVITSEDIARVPVGSVAELLSDLPGVTGGYSNVGAGSKISFRGMPDKYTLILVNGKRVGNQSLLGHRTDKVEQDLNWISPEMIERIEVVRGSMSTLYGSEAVGGVINIITKDVPAALSGSLTGNYRKPDTSTRGETALISTTLAGPITESIGFRLGASFSDRDPSTDANGGTSGSKDENASLHLDWAINNNHSVTLDGSWGNDKSTTSTEASGESFGYDMERIGFGLGYQGYFGDAVLNADAYHNSIENNDSTFESGSSANAIAANTKSKAEETVLDLKLNKPLTLLGFNQDLTLGAQYKEEKVSNAQNIGNINSPAFGDGVLEPENYTWSLFAEDQIYLKENLIFTAGARLDNDEEFGSNLSPRAYIVWHPEEQWTVKGGVSNSFRAPNLKERSGSSGTSSMGMGCTSLIPFGWQSGEMCYMVGNPDLDPETSTNYEFGLGYEQDGYKLDAVFFLSDIKDLITNNVWTYDPAKPGLGPDGRWYTIATNVEEARTSGIELSTELPLTANVKFTGNVTYILESENKSTGAPLNQVPEQTINASVLWDVTDKLSVNAKAQYLGKQRYNAYLENSTSNLYFVDAFTTADIGFNYKVNSNIILRGGVENVAGAKPTVNDRSDDYGTPNPTVYYAGFTTRF